VSKAVVPAGFVCSVDDRLGLLHGIAAVLTSWSDKFLLQSQLRRADGATARKNLAFSRDRDT